MVPLFHKCAISQRLLKVQHINVTNQNLHKCAYNVMILTLATIQRHIKTREIARELAIRVVTTKKANGIPLRCDYTDRDRPSGVDSIVLFGCLVKEWGLQGEGFKYNEY